MVGTLGPSPPPSYGHRGPEGPGGGSEIWLLENRDMVTEAQRGREVVKYGCLKTGTWSQRPRGAGR